MKKIIITTAVIFFSMAGIADAAPDSNSIIRNGIEYYIQTDKSVYNLGENVEMLYRVTNLGVEDDVEFIFSYGPLDNTCDWMVDKDELRIWDNLGRPGTAVMTSFNLSPSESYEYTNTWDMTYKNGDNILPGNYNVTGVLGYSSSYERYVPVSVPIEIIPEPAKIYYVDSLGSDDNDGLSKEKPFATIQKAIDSAFDSDTVLVADGTYTGPGNRNLDFLGKAITVRSESGPENCIIDCNHAGCGFKFDDDEDANSILDGFTITNGFGRGGGIYCRDSSPTIKNCIITGNMGGAPLVVAAESTAGTAVRQLPTALSAGISQKEYPAIIAARQSPIAV